MNDVAKKVYELAEEIVGLPDEEFFEVAAAAIARVGASLDCPRPVVMPW
jgi:hypothetical protein